jgi:hypothetical protein
MATNGEAPDISIECDLGENGGLLRFSNLEAVDRWLNDEQQKWSWVQGTRADRETNLFGIWIFQQGFSAIRERVNDAKNTKATRPQGYAASVESVKQIIIDRFNNTKRILASNTPRAKFIFALAEKDKETAAYALTQYLGIEYASQSPKSREGAALAALFDHKLISTSDAEKAAFEDLRFRWTKELEGFKGEYEKLHGLHIASYNYAETAGQEFARSSSQMLKKFEDDGTNFMAGHSLRMQQMEQLFETRLKLEAPVNYWREKKKYHEKIRNWLTVVCIIVGSVGFWQLGAFVSSEFSATAGVAPMSASQSQAASTLAGSVPWHPILLFIIFSSALFWVVRICVRLLLSNIHLATDAHEREVMAMTYLALAKANEQGHSYVSDKDIGVVLAALFRPTSSGIVSDDGAPATAYEMIQAMVQKNRG